MPTARPAGLAIWQFGEEKDLVAGALRLDELGLVGDADLDRVRRLRHPAELARGDRRPRPGPGGHGEFQALLIASVLGMALLAMAQNLVIFFVGLELLSVPLYVLCGSALRRRTSLESGLKYLIVGSLGSATLLYGLAFIYGGSGSTDFTGIREGIGAGIADDPLILIGIALTATGLAFKLSIAPFHQWTPGRLPGRADPGDGVHGGRDQGRRLRGVRPFLPGRARPGRRRLAARARRACRRLDRRRKRRRADAELAQAPARLLRVSPRPATCSPAIVAANEAGIEALFFYLVAYAFMNLAAFAVITIRERETGFGDDIRSVQGLGRERPMLAWPLTIAMLALAGLPGTAGFIGKLYLIEASVAGDFTWLGVMIAVGTMISLAYYLRVIAAVWMRPAYLSDPTPEAAQPRLAGDGGRVRGARGDSAASAAASSSAFTHRRGLRCRLLRGPPLAARRLRLGDRRVDHLFPRLRGRRQRRHGPCLPWRCRRRRPRRASRG